MAAKSKYNNRKNVLNKANLDKHCKIYKRTMNKYIAQFRKEQEEKLRNLQQNNQKVYWRYLNSLHKNKNENEPPASCFYDYYKNVNTKNSTDQDDIFADDFCTDDDNEVLNSKISQEEILQCIHSLKNCKAAGDR